MVCFDKLKYNAKPGHWHVIGLPVLSALILIGAFPPFEQGYLAWIALIPLVAVLKDTSLAQAFKSGYLFGLCFNLYVNLYLATVLFNHLSPALAWLAMILLIAYLALFPAIFALAAAYIFRLKKPVFSVLAVPTLWMLLEYSRSIGFLGYNVGYIGYSQWQYSSILNLAATYGYWGLSFIIVFAQTIIIFLADKNFKAKDLSIALVILAAMAGFGLLAPQFYQIEKEETPLSIMMVQGNSRPEQLAGNRQAHEQLYLELTDRKVKPETDLVIWPETVIDLNLSTTQNQPRALTDLVDQSGFEILYGARVREENQLYNSIIHYRPGQDQFNRYDKIRLVPFVEFFPADQLLNRLININLLLGSYSAGEEIIIFEIKNNPLAGAICFESYFGDLTRLFALHGARHLFILTNDAWFEETIGLEMHAQAAAIRAAEMGIGITQVANTGITISFDYRGREQFRTDKQVQAVISEQFDLARRPTLYRHYGDYFCLIWLAFLLTGTGYLHYRKQFNL